MDSTATGPTIGPDGTSATGSEIASGSDSPVREFSRLPWWIRAVLGHRSRMVAIAGLVGGFAAYKLVEALAGPALTWQDSLFYEEVGRAAITSGGFWAGHFPPLAPLLWKLTGTRESFVVTQTVVSILAWSTTAMVLASRVRRGWGRVLTGAVVLALASSQYVIEWDRSVLSETTTLAFVPPFVAALVGYASRSGRGWFAAVVISAIGMVEGRDSDIVTIALVGIGILISAATIYARRSPSDRSLPRGGLGLGAALIVVAALAGGATVAAGRNGSYIGDDLYVRAFPYPARDAFFAAHGMPEAGLVEALAAATTTPPGQAPVVAPTGPAFASLTSWVDAGHATSVYVLWLLTHPVYVVSAPFASPQEAYNYASGNLAFYSAAGSPATPVLSTVLYRWWASAATAALALALGVWRHLWRSRVWQVTAGLALVGLVTMLIAWQADGQEVTRHILEGSVQVRLTVLALLVLGVGGPQKESAGAACSGGGWVTRPRGQTPGEDAVDSPV